VSLKTSVSRHFSCALALRSTQLYVATATRPGLASSEAASPGRRPNTQSGELKFLATFCQDTARHHAHGLNSGPIASHGSNSPHRAPGTIRSSSESVRVGAARRSRQQRSRAARRPIVDIGWFGEISRARAATVISIDTGGAAANRGKAGRAGSSARAVGNAFPSWQHCGGAQRYGYFVCAQG